MSTIQSSKPPVPALARIESQYRRFLARRWFSLMWRASVWSGLVTGSATLFVTGHTNGFCIGILFGVLGFPISLYPLLQAYSNQLRHPPKTLSRSSVRPAALFSTSVTAVSSLRLIASYVIFASAFTFLYCQSVQAIAPSKALGILSPTQRHPLHLNERFIFLLFGHVLVYICLAIGDIVGRRIKTEWPSRKMPLHLAARNSLSQGFASFAGHGLVKPSGTVSQAAAVTALFYVSYTSLRRSVWTMLYTHSAGLLKPFIINFVRSSHAAVNWQLCLHLQFLTATSLLIMRPVTTMINAYITQPLDFSSFAVKSPLSPDRYLLTALGSSDAYYSHFTLMELVRISRDSARRKAIFADISKQPVLTHELWQALLLHLGSAHQTLSIRGGSTASSTAPAVQPRPIRDSHTIALKSADIFRPAVKQRSTIASTLQHVLDGPPQNHPAASQAVVRAEEIAKAMEAKAVGQVKGATEQVIGRIEGTQVGAQVITEARGWLDGMNDWAGRVWADRQVTAALPEISKTLWIIDILTTLMVASAEEDLYGHVQQVLPATLEAFVRLRSTAIGFEKELAARASSVNRGEKTATEESSARISPMIHACETAIHRVAERFGTSLTSFRFPPAIAAALTDIGRTDDD
ncbi:nucleoporin protein Ndc1-Nup [Kockovaella imperatae]|uniref:Nucleoporin protein Ndc1-Nup n=1 Tax=Kockovaella imperatae TaxID=4999 RepID=A0A1Y1UQF8_9TREE|nr:nucleoporin protein Ndc1-Nup [Kockovaella imperatae]ORX40202.1 nucleoporin protein Ndc1-Nup [Kockovaella imperatae]